MFEHKGWWLPDGEDHLTGMLDLGEVVYGRHSYQYKKYLLAKPYIKNYRRVLDIGSHVGLWSWYFQQEFQFVDAFEPVEDHRACFYKNIEGSNVTLHPYACGSENGVVRMVVNPTSSGDTWVDPDCLNEHQQRRMNRLEPGYAQQVVIDDFGFEDVDFVKVDCEGYELHCLEGAEGLLLQCKPVVIVEQKPGRAQKFGLAETGAVAFLEDLGMKLVGQKSGDYILSW